MVNNIKNFIRKVNIIQRKLVSNIAGEDILEQHLKDSRIFIISTILSYIPLWLFITPFLSKPKNFYKSLSETFTNGEFALYTFSLLLGSFYIIQKQFNPIEKVKEFEISFPKRNLFNYAFFLLMFASAGIGALSYFNDWVVTNSFGGGFLDNAVIQYISFALFLFSLLLVYIVAMINHSLLLYKYDESQAAGKNLINKIIKTRQDSVNVLITKLESLDSRN